MHQDAQTSSGAEPASHLKDTDGFFPWGEVTISQLRLVPRLRMYEILPLLPALHPTPVCLHVADRNTFPCTFCSV
jgi:hypothetical protein